MLHAIPRTDYFAANVCAFCHYWEGDAYLHSHGQSQVEFDERAKGRCLKLGVMKTSCYSACSKFQISNEASRYAKR